MSWFIPGPHSCSHYAGPMASTPLSQSTMCPREHGRWVCIGVCVCGVCDSSVCVASLHTTHSLTDGVLCEQSCWGAIGHIWQYTDATTRPRPLYSSHGREWKQAMDSHCWYWAQQHSHCVGLLHRVSLLPVCLCILAVCHSVPVCTLFDGLGEGTTSVALSEDAKYLATLSADTPQVDTHMY